METQESSPDPGYFEFDHIIDKLPELYHQFALSTVGAIEGLLRILDLNGAVVADIGAGTGRSAMTLARDAYRVVAIELQPDPIAFAAALLAGSAIENVSYVRGDSRNLPLKDKSVDHALAAWSVIDHAEAQRVTRTGGYVWQIGAGPANMCGELTPVLAEAFDVPRPSDPSPDDFWYGDLGSPWEHVEDGSGYHDVEYLADYGSVEEACRIWGRIYGPVAEGYLRRAQKTGVKYRLRISHYQVP